MKETFLRTMLIAIASSLFFTSCSLTKEERTASYNSQKLETKQELFAFKPKDKIVDVAYSEPKEVLASENWMPSKIRSVPVESILSTKHFRKNHIKAYLPNPVGDCDEIKLYGGEHIQAKIVEVSDHEIKYKKCDNPDGPTFTVSKSKVNTVRYANGTEETITDSTGESSEVIAPLTKHDYLGLSLLMLLFSILSYIVASLIVGAGFLTASTAVISVSLIFGFVFGFADVLFGIAFGVYFVLWLLKLVS